jgi:hypothetical protein
MCLLSSTIVQATASDPVLALSHFDIIVGGL